MSVATLHTRTTHTHTQLAELLHIGLTLSRAFLANDYAGGGGGALGMGGFLCLQFIKQVNNF